MPKVKDLSVDDLEHLIEQKVLEILGDPDSGLELRDEFKRKLNCLLYTSDAADE